MKEILDKIIGSEITLLELMTTRYLHSFYHYQYHLLPLPNIPSI